MTVSGTKNINDGFVRFYSPDRPLYDRYEFKVNRFIDGMIDVDYDLGIDASSLAAQLSQLGIKNIDINELQKIAAQNGNATIDREEMGMLDAYLEDVLSKDKEFVLNETKNAR